MNVLAAVAVVLLLKLPSVRLDLLLYFRTAYKWDFPVCEN